MRRVVKYIVIGLIAIFVLLNALALFTQTALFRKILTDKVTTIINDYLEGEFAIESIEGNFYDKIVLNNISLRNDKETVLELEKLSLNYLLHPLLRKQIRIKSTELDGLKVNLTEENGRWNFEDLLPINEDKVTKERDENQGFSIDLPFNIRLNSFEITNVDAVIVSNSKR
ncbi:MAG: AsmA family protein, partial [Candidatus Cloacimonas sp.]|nr:AsmA family protein [Candidatus Cloacimonadota bacterium]